MSRSSPAIFYGFDNQAMPSPERLHWDIFCHVVDNFGDVGVCWRLACELARRGDAVRLVIDDASALAWMAPAGCTGVEVCAWPGPGEPGDVVIEAFGCDPPAAFVQAMVARRPVWINLEYLSAESYVERSHGLPSPQHNGLTKWFFYPGFTPHTGGLLREAGLADARAAFDRSAWLAKLDLVVADGERVASLFCYDNAALPLLLASLAQQPTLLLLTPGHAERQVGLLEHTLPKTLRLARLPWLSQHDFDHLLWACDLNVVRGEDSLLRALWAGAPFVWQAYVQDGGAHWEKVDAMLAQWAPPAEVATLWRAWNGAPQTRWTGLTLTPAWAQATHAWRDRLAEQPDLATRLRAFARLKAAGAAAGTTWPAARIAGFAPER